MVYRMYLFQTNRRCGEQYTSFQERCGLSVSIAHLKCYTTKFNRLFIRLGQCKPRLLRYWFTCGACFGVVLMFVAVALLLMTLVKAFSQDKPEQVLTPVVSWEKNFELKWGRLLPHYLSSCLSYFLLLLFYLFISKIFFLSK